MTKAEDGTVEASHLDSPSIVSSSAEGQKEGLDEQADHTPVPLRVDEEPAKHKTRVMAERAYIFLNSYSLISMTPRRL